MAYRRELILDLVKIRVSFFVVTETGVGVLLRLEHRNSLLVNELLIPLRAWRRACAFADLFSNLNFQFSWPAILIIQCPALFRLTFAHLRKAGGAGC